jgi:hypothetical protein
LDSSFKNDYPISELANLALGFTVGGFECQLKTIRHGHEKWRQEMQNS